jgi:hypothetical protein
MQPLSFSNIANTFKVEVSFEQLSDLDKYALLLALIKHFAHQVPNDRYEYFMKATGPILTTVEGLVLK